MRRFEFQEGTSNKFWEITLEGTSFTVRFGKLGTDGQASTKSFPTPDAARAEHDKLIREKTRKGYVEQGAPPVAPQAAGPKRTTSAKSTTLKIFADYHHFYLCDATCESDLGDAWTAQAVDDRLAVGEGVIGIGTARNVDVPVEIQILAKAPDDDADAFQHVTECSLPVPTGTLIVNGPTDSAKAARPFTVPPGTVRVRASHKGLDTLSDDGLKGKDSYRLAIWPAAASAPRVVKQWTPPAKKPPVATEIKPPKTFKQAVAAALAGRVDLALPKLVELSRTKREGYAAVSTTEILAFMGDWRGVIEHGGIFIEDLTVFGARNVFDDTLRLLRRAGRETGDWGAVAAAAKRVPKEAVATFHDAAKAFVREVGKGRYDEPTEPAEVEDRAVYAKAVHEAPLSKRFRDRPSELPRHLFSLAKAYGVDDECLALFAAHPDSVDFDGAMHVARILATRRRPDEAWAAIEAKLPTWSAGWVTSIAPIELVVDPVLAPLLTPARAAQVLATPRGLE